MLAGVARACEKLVVHCQLERPDDFAVVFADPDQLSLFTPPLAAMRPILTTMIAGDSGD